MILPRIAVCAMAASLTFGAAAQTQNAQTQRMIEGQNLRAGGHFAEARKVFTSVLREAEKAQPDSSLVALVLDNLGVTETELGDHGGAERDLNRAHTILNGGPQDDRIALAVTRHLAELYVAEHRATEAEPLLRQSLAALASSASPNRVALALAYDDLGVVSAMQGKRPAAEKYLRQSMALLEAEEGPDNPMLAGCLEPMAALFLTEHRYAEAAAVAERAWKLLQSAPLPIGPPDRASALDILGDAYAHTGRIAEGVSDAEQAVTLAEELYGPNHPILGVYLKCYADVLKQANRKSEARAVKRRADDIMAHAARNTMGGATVSINALR
jgi:tetratricopeptide (TPR) repeat protein